jgi:hypothetical protein
VGATFLTIGFILGGYNIYRKIVHALEESTVSMPADVVFNRGTAGGLAGYDNGSGTVAVLSSEIRIATASSWYSADFRYKMPVSLKNLSETASVTATASGQVTLDTASLVAAGKLQADCDDLRVAYAATGSGTLRSELPRTYQLASGATDCSDSPATTITFPIQSTLWLDGGTDTGYELYYGNPEAAAPAGGVTDMIFSALTVLQLQPASYVRLTAPHRARTMKRRQPRGRYGIPAERAPLTLTGMTIRWT